MSPMHPVFASAHGDLDTDDVIDKQGHTVAGLLVAAVEGLGRLFLQDAVGH